MDKNELWEDLQLDKHNLDIENEQQSKLTVKWGRRLSFAIREKNDAEKNFKIKEASLFLRCKSGEYDGDAKLTDSVAKYWVRSHEEYDEAYSKLNQSEEVVGLCFTAVNSMKDKRQTINEEIKLYLGGYFARVSVDSKKLSQTQDSVFKKEMSKVLTKKLKKTRRKV